MDKTLLIAGLAIAGGAFAAHGGQRAADAARFARRGEERTLYQPRGEALRVAALGYHGLLADVIWVRTVLQFADLLVDKQPEDAEWLRLTVDAVVVLDPTWRTPYFYGGGFMRLMGDIDASDEFYSRGMVSVPDDPFFPFSLGMNAYLHRGDSAKAAEWLRRAAQMPKAPAWYHAAAAAFIEGEGERRAAIRYIEDQIARESRPEVLESLAKKRAQLIHDELAEQMNAARAQWEGRTGEPLTTPGVLGTLPEDPLGGQWVVAPDGQIRSSVQEARLDGEGRLQERSMLMLRPGKRGFPASSGL